MLYDRLSFRRFCGFGLEATLPDATTILGFRSLLQGQSEKLLNLVNEELSEKGITWTGGSIVDATVIESKSETPSGGEQSLNWYLLTQQFTIWEVISPSKAASINCFINGVKILSFPTSAFPIFMSAMALFLTLQNQRRILLFLPAFVSPFFTRLGSFLAD